MTDRGGDGRDPEGPRNDRTHVRILLALMAVVITAAIVALVGELVLENPVIREVGFWIAILGGIAYFSVRIHGRIRARQWREEQVRRKLARDPEPDDEDEEKIEEYDRGGDRRR